MFNLEHAIANWRHSLVRAGLSPEVIDELEAHLRDEIDQQQAGVPDLQLAFDHAIKLLGDPAQLEEQFKASGEDKKGRGSVPIAVLAKVAAVLVVPLATVVLLYYVRAFNLQSNQVGIPVGWLAFTAATLSALVILWRVTHSRPGFLRSVPNNPFPTSRLQSPLFLEQARAEALALGHDFIGTEHLLLALLKESDSQNKPPLLNLDYESVRSEVSRLIAPNPPHPRSIRPPLTPRANQALQIADREAKRRNHPRVTSDHIFSGLILEGSGAAAQVLNRLRSA